MVIQRRAVLSFLFAALVAQATVSRAAILTWDGGGANNNWNTALNWNPNNAPVANDSLFFDGVTRLSNNNDLPAGTQINGLTFGPGAGLFALSGNAITLHGDLVDNRQIRRHVINLDMALDATRTINVVDQGAVAINGAITGSGFGLTKAGPGTVTLQSGANTFSGPLTIKDGTLNFHSTSDLGAGNLIIEGGRLRLSIFNIIAIPQNIALGPSSGSGSGTLYVAASASVTHFGSVTNNAAGAGGFVKDGFGFLELRTANTYTGPTVVKNGFLVLNFNLNSASNEILYNGVSSNRQLVMNGAFRDGGNATYAHLDISGRSGDASNTQTFDNTLIDVGPARINVSSASANSITVNLGALTHNPGGALVLGLPSSGNVTTTTANTNGILGGWATIGTKSGAGLVESPSGTNIAVAEAWASNDGSGNIVPYTFQPNETFVTGHVLHADAPFLATNRNLQITTASTGNIVVNTAGAGTTTDINTVEIAPATTNLLGRFLDIGAGNTLRLGKHGGFFRADSTTAPVDNSTPPQSFEIGTPSGTPDRGIQDAGTLTAGGAPNTAGEIVFTINAPSQTNAQTNVDAKIADNGSGAVTVIKAGPGSMKLRGHNTYSGGTFILQGRMQLAGLDVGTSNPGGFGTGPVSVSPGAQAVLSGVGGVGSGTVPNDFKISGTGIANEGSGAIRLAAQVTLAGTITMTGNVRIAGNDTSSDGIISGRITGPYDLEFGTPSNVPTLITLSNPNNDWSGDTTIKARNSGSDFSRITLGASNVIPDGPGKGDLYLEGSGTSGARTVFNLDGFNETINGLFSTGVVNATNMFVQNNQNNSTSTLTLGNDDQTAAYAGVIRDANPSGNGQMNIFKIGAGTQTFSGANTYTGVTRVEAGTLLVNGSHTGAGSYFVDADATLGGTGSISFAGGSSLDVAGTLAPGASIESLDVTGNVAFEATSFLTIELSGGLIDLLSVTGDISVANGAIAQFLVTGTPTLSEYVFATYTGNLTGAFTSSSVPAGYSLVQGGGELRLVQVPEPATWLLAAIGLMGAAHVVRRSRRNVRA